MIAQNKVFPFFQIEEEVEESQRKQRLLYFL